jgi:hypothetical protein
MNNLENELNSFNATSINSINKEDKYDRDLFKDVNTPQTCSNNKDINVSSFVKDLEKNLDNFDNLDLDSGPMPSNVNSGFKNNIKNNSSKNDENIKEEPIERKIKKPNLNKKIYERLIKLKEPIVIIFLFILLNNDEFIAMLNTIPYFNLLGSPYPSLILRGSIMAFLIYNLKKYSK